MYITVLKGVHCPLVIARQLDPKEASDNFSTASLHKLLCNPSSETGHVSLVSWHLKCIILNTNFSLAFVFCQPELTLVMIDDVT